MGGIVDLVGIWAAVGWHELHQPLGHGRRFHISLEAAFLIDPPLNKSRMVNIICPLQQLAPKEGNMDRNGRGKVRRTSSLLLGRCTCELQDRFHGLNCRSVKTMIQKVFIQAEVFIASVCGSCSQDSYSKSGFGYIPKLQNSIPRI